MQVPGPTEMVAALKAGRADAAILIHFIVLVLLFGLIKMSPNRLIIGSAVTYIEILRGASLPVQLYWIFFVLLLFGITLEKFTAVWVSIGLNAGTYGAELVRGGITSVPKGQWEAATAINMSSARRMWRIILPQALVNMLPAWGNLMVEILKGIGLVSLISVADLMFQAKPSQAKPSQAKSSQAKPSQADQRKHLYVCTDF